MPLRNGNMLFIAAVKKIIVCIEQELNCYKTNLIGSANKTSLFESDAKATTGDRLIPTEE